MSGILEIVVAQIWQATILCVVAGWVTRTVLRRHPVWCYRLWILVLLKSITPPIWASECGVFSWFFHHLSSATASLIQRVLGLQFATGLLLSVVFVWLVGMIATLWGTWRQWQILQRRLKNSRVVVPDSFRKLVARLAQQLGIRSSIKIMITSEHVGPGIVGIWTPVLILPESLVAGRDSAKLEPIVAHELLHVRRGDMWVALLEAIVQAVWWFHPQLKAAVKEASLAGEFCCDDDVLQELACEPRAYADCLLDVLAAKCRLQPVVAAGVKPEQVTQHRLRRIMSYHGDQKRSRLLAVGILLIGLLTLLPGRSVNEDQMEPGQPGFSAVEATINHSPTP